ncbi:thiol reductant ABC exporter subunit CydD [Rubrobacter indicoceani]|uniref:thiol reductant ABC exporter subunit CydD n=1 Tax=Rubrobacter indicoceani TaxID=2051957 RepID=UPI000E5BB384|nr:thiol reductant ABC exporter subunit CydD [Rubrobacter indicoceani]
MSKAAEKPAGEGKSTRSRAERAFLNRQMVYGRFGVFGSVAFGVLGTVCTIVAAYATASALAGVVVSGASVFEVSGWFWVLGAAVVFRSAFGFFQERLAANASISIRRGVRRRIVVRLTSTRRDPDGAPPGAGATTTAFIEQVDKLDGYYSRFVPLTALAVLAPLIMLAVILPVNWVVAVILALSAPLIPLYMALVGLGAEDASRRQMDSMRRLSGYFLDRLQGLPTLRRLGYASREPENIRVASEELRRRTMKVLRIAFLSSTVLEFFATFSIAIAATYVGLSLLGWISFGAGATGIDLRDGLFLLLLAPAYFQPLRDFAASYHDRADALAAAGDLMPLTGGDPDGGDPGDETGRDGLFTPAYAPEVKLCDATVQYAGRTAPALDCVDLKVPAGGSVALLGPSGGGKSTLLGLVAGQIGATGGEVSVDGNPAAFTSPATTAWVGQRPYLFPATIRENIALGQSDRSPAEINAAAEKARVTAFAAQLPAGLDTVLGERGAGLSGGEAQRVALARAFLKDAPVVLLDEPTANLDATTEAEISETIRTLIEGRTALIATHRSPLARLCSSTVRLEEGRITRTVENV